MDPAGGPIRQPEAEDAAERSTTGKQESAQDTFNVEGTHGRAELGLALGSKRKWTSSIS